MIGKLGAALASELLNCSINQVSAFATTNKMTHSQVKNQMRKTLVLMLLELFIELKSVYSGVTCCHLSAMISTIKNKTM